MRTRTKGRMKLCDCGCGKPAGIAKQTDPSRGYVKGQPTRYAHGHNGRKAIKDMTCANPSCGKTVGRDRHGTPRKYCCVACFRAVGPQPMRVVSRTRALTPGQRAALGYANPPKRKTSPKEAETGDSWWLGLSRADLHAEAERRFVTAPQLALNHRGGFGQ